MLIIRTPRLTAHFLTTSLVQRLRIALVQRRL